MWLLIHVIISVEGGPWRQPHSGADTPLLRLPSAVLGSIQLIELAYLQQCKEWITCSSIAQSWYNTASYGMVLAVLHAGQQWQKHTTVCHGMSSRVEYWGENWLCHKGTWLCVLGSMETLAHWGRDINWPPFCRQLLRMDFLEWKCKNVYQNLIEICSKGSN